VTTQLQLIIIIIIIIIISLLSEGQKCEAFTTSKNKLFFVYREAMEKEILSQCLTGNLKNSLVFAPPCAHQVSST
jgi:hypothetical protein